LKKLRILLADDHDVVRHGIKCLLEERPDWVVCGEARTGREAVALAAALQPNVAVLDLAMPDLNGIEATRQIAKVSPETETLLFTVHMTEALLPEVIAAGARGYLLKSDAAKSITTAVESVAHHRPFFSPAVSATAGSDHTRGARQTGGETRSAQALTPREREVTQLIAEGRSNKKIATLLDLSVKTVETHRAAVMRKLGVNSVAGVVRYAVRNHLTEV
jgi:DNA-binding NarL/FixJ family response regulator